MLDLFKKTPEEPEKVSEEKQLNPVEDPKIAQEQLNTEETLMSMLERLNTEESSLKTQKAQLVEMEEKLRFKIVEEIEAKKRNIEDLKTAIPDLKQKCENLAKALEIPVYK